MAVEAVEPESGDTVLISGATGGVGVFAIQLAKRPGARIIATARPTKAEFLRKLGADEVVDHTKGLSGELRKLGIGAVECALHLAGDGLELADQVQEGGRFASTLEVGPDQLAGRLLHATAVHASANLSTQSLEALGREVEAGRLKVPITRTYGLMDMPQAFKDFRAGTLGKLAIAVR